MHVCHVITRLIIGGAQENTLLTCAGLHERGVRVTLIAGPTLGPEGSLVAQARAAGYEYIEVPELIRAVNPWYDARAYRLMRMHFDRLRPDIVHTHSSKAGILGRFAARDARVPVIVHTIHGMSFNRTQSRLTRMLYSALERRAARCTRRIYAVADAMIEQTVAAGICRREKLLTVYSGMEVGRFTPNPALRAAVRRQWGVSDEHIVVGTVARLFRRKGYEQLLPIMTRAAARNPNMRFVWVGDGAQREEYERDLAARGLASRTILTGLAAPDQIPALLDGFDILAHTSQWEGLPRVVVQSLLMRVPAVAFEIDGTPEVVLTGRTGVLVALGDEAGFAAALNELASNPERRAAFGAAGRELCLSRFDNRHMVDVLEQDYEKLRMAGTKR